jgi:hypothetical protein
MDGTRANRGAQSIGDDGALIIHRLELCADQEAQPNGTRTRHLDGAGDRQFLLQKIWVYQDTNDFDRNARVSVKISKICPRKNVQAEIPCVFVDFMYGDSELFVTPKGKALLVHTNLARAKVFRYLM